MERCCSRGTAGQESVTIEKLGVSGYLPTTGLNANSKNCLYSEGSTWREQRTKIEILEQGEESERSTIKTKSRQMRQLTLRSA